MRLSIPFPRTPSHPCNPPAVLPPPLSRSLTRSTSSTSKPFNLSWDGDLSRQRVHAVRVCARARKVPSCDKNVRGSEATRGKDVGRMPRLYVFTILGRHFRVSHVEISSSSSSLFRAETRQPLRERTLAAHSTPKDSPRTRDGARRLPRATARVEI